MKRLLAKLPRSSSGSRELSARSSAAAFPADILEVSITDADETGFALVSSTICFSGASGGEFMRVAQASSLRTNTTQAGSSRYI